MPLKPLLPLLTLLVLAPAVWCAPKYKVLHAFTAGDDGGSLWGSLLTDTRGNVYGTTSYGGPHEGGTVFELTRRSDGSWSETTLYNFCSRSECTDGAGSTAGMIFDKDGNLYGTTGLGGTYERGTVFGLTPQSDKAWTETVLYAFDEGATTPYGGVVMDPYGNLYGTAGGYAYELSPGSGGWTLTDLHEFTGQNGDGAGTAAGAILDGAGNLYGTTGHGGGSHNCGEGCGTVYKLHPGPDGSWKETILHSFGGTGDGSFPGVGALIMDKTGRLYGTTASGAIFRLTRAARDRWKETILYNITGGKDGQEPAAGVVMDKAGNLFGTTIASGPSDCGVVYKLAPQAKGKWKYTVLHSLAGYDGCQPDANLILDSKGNLYGTTATGGTDGYGVAFELTP